MSLQLPLGIQLPDVATFDSYTPGTNGLVVDLLKQMALGVGEPQLYLWGELNTGKSHLLQAACRIASINDRLASYLPLSQLIEYGPDVLHGFENIDLLCLDELDILEGKAEWQQALFNLINGIRANEGKLVIAAPKNIPQLEIQLPDLISRLHWGPVFQLKSLDDESKLEMLQIRAQMRGLELSCEVGSYLLKRYPRDVKVLCELIDKLDQASLAAQRRLTIPFAKSVLE